jgi:hypothetical protein
VRTLILTLCSLALFLPLAADPSWATEPERWLPGPGGNPADMEREVLWLDGPDFAEMTGSSEVIGALDFWTEIASAFWLDTDATIRKVTWWGSYWNGYDGSPTGAGFNIRFYMTATEYYPEDVPFLEYLLPGDDCCEAYASGGDQYSQFVYEYCLDLPLDPGIYWFSSQMADHQFPPQWGRLGADDPGHYWVSMFRSPYYSYPDWVPAGELDYWWASQMLEDACEATPIQNASWGAVRGLYR